MNYKESLKRGNLPVNTGKSSRPASRVSGRGPDKMLESGSCKGNSLLKNTKPTASHNIHLYASVGKQHDKDISVENKSAGVETVTLIEFLIHLHKFCE